MSAIIFDTETTGLEEPEIIEAAWARITLAEDRTPEDSFYGRFKPSKRIDLGAMAVHHIMDEDLESCPPSSDFALPDDTEYLIGHNVDYDWAAAGKPEVKRICTLALSRYLWPDADSHSLSAMMYLLRRSEARNLLKNAHSAMQDVENCYRLLSEILIEIGGAASFEALWELSEIARIPTRMMFGKHKGTLIKDVPADYKAWLLRQPDIDQYLIKALKACN